MKEGGKGWGQWAAAWNNTEVHAPSTCKNASNEEYMESPNACAYTKMADTTEHWSSSLLTLLNYI